MREFSVPATTEVGPDEALTDMLATNVAEHGDEVGLPRPARTASGRTSPGRSSATRSPASPRASSPSGVAAGDRVALQAKTRYEWTVLDFAIWTAGAVVVPIYETSSADQVAWILSDSGATAVDRRARRARRAPSSPSATRRPTCGRSTSSTTTRSARSPQAGKDVPDSELEARRADAHRRQPGHADLHQRHHRPAQGLRAHPRATSCSRSATA